MKKIFIFAATAALLASCAQDEVLNNYEPTADKAIGFSTIANKVTRAENSKEDAKLDLYLHHESFSVYGYKNVNASPKGINVFNDQSVTVNLDNTTSYDPVRYWDKAASDYFFYAAAPASPTDGAWSFIVPTETDLSAGTINTGYYTTSSALTGANITTFTGDDAFTYQEYFKGSGDIDKLIADPCPVQNPAYNKSTADVVELNFNHILSRLNVEVKSAITPTMGQVTVTIDEESNLPLFSYGEGSLCVESSGTYYQVDKSGDTYSYVFQGEQSEKVEVNTEANPVTAVTEVKSGKVELVAITVNDFKGTGDFNENASLGTDVLKDGTIKRWSNLSGTENVEYEPETALNLSVAQNGLAVDAYKYVCQSLVIPQQVEYEAINLDGTSATTKPYINVQFKIDGQPYSYFYNLAAVFSPELQSVFEDDGGKWAKDINDGKVYVKDGKYSSAKDAAEYTTVVLKNGNAYTLADGTTPVYYYNSKYYTTMTSETAYDDEITPDRIIPVYEIETSGTYAPQFLTNAEAIAEELRTAEAFALDFNEGWQNNLQVKIGPSAIQFIGHVYKWDNYKTSELIVQ